MKGLRYLQGLCMILHAQIEVAMGQALSAPKFEWVSLWRSDL